MRKLQETNGLKLINKIMKTEKIMDFGTIFDITKNTIGFNLVSVKPMSDEELSEYNKKMKEEREKWEKEHIDNVEAMKRFEKKSGSKKEYELSRSERDVVKELLHMDDNLLDSCTITKMNDGEISVSTSRGSWMSLSGREWWINVENKTAKCVMMS